MAAHIDASNGAGQKRKADDSDDHGPISFGRVPPYSPRVETAPKSVILSKEWETFIEGKKHLYNLLMAPLTKATVSNGLVMDMVERIEKALTSPRNEDIVVGLSGNMNTGKSSTLNSLFECNDIALAGDSGASCTLATHIYRGPKPDQDVPLLAEVHFLERKARRDTLSGYLSGYYRALNGSDDDDTTADASNNDDAQTDVSIRDHVADALVSLFCDDHPQECKTPSLAKRFLEAATSENDEGMQAKLFTWADQVIRKHTGDKQTVIVTAFTGRELLGKLEPYATATEGDYGEKAFSLWPMVKEIHIHFDDPITRIGITISDSPGTSDANITRRELARKHRAQRTHALVFTDEARAKDDANIPSEVRAMKKKGADRVTVVSTKSDDISDKGTQSGSRRKKEIIQELKKKVSELENELNAVELQISAASTDAQRGALSTKRLELEIRVRRAQNAEKAHRISMRSESNKAALQETLETLTKSPKPVTFFSVSNIEYSKHLLGFPPNNTPILSVEETNIPALRGHILTFPNEARLNECRHQLSAVIPGMLNRMEIYVSRTPTDRKADLDGYVQRPNERYVGLIKSTFGYASDTLKLTLLGPMKKEEADFLTKASKQCDRWGSEFKTGVFLGLMNRNGRRKGTKRSREINICDELMQLKENQVKELFLRGLKEIERLGGDIKEDFNSMCNELVQDMKADSNATFMDLAPFYKYVDNGKLRLRKAVDDVGTRLNDGIEAVQRNANYDNESEAYILKALQPIFAEVRGLKGGKGATEGIERPKMGWAAYRKSIFKQKVTSLNGLWTILCDGVEADLNELLQTEKETLLTEVGEVFNDFVTAFDLMCETKENSDPAEVKLREELKVNLAEAREYLHGPMQAAVDALLRDFR